MRRFGVLKKRYLFAVPVLILLIALTAWAKVNPADIRRFRPAAPTQMNPLMGFAVDATIDPASVPIDHSLVYAVLTWRELEPAEGVFDFEGFEARNHLATWWALGKRVVLRFVMDVPRETAHCDIPDWLVEKLGDEAGVAYDNEYGRGFSPNYADSRLSALHEQAIAALGARYDGQPGIAFVEIGSFGHDGSWTVLGNLGIGGMPPATDLRACVGFYHNAFPNTRLLAPAPYLSVRLIKAGLYNEQIGNERFTWDWLDAIDFGGYDAAVGAEERPMSDFARRQTSGAHLGRGVSVGRLFTRGLNGLLGRIEACKTSYIAGLSAEDLTPELLDGIACAQAEMGYRLWIREAVYPSRIRAGYRLSVGLTVMNDGVQPMSADWPLELSLMRDGQVVYAAKTLCKACDLLPGKQTIYARMTLPNGLSGYYDIGLAILDPQTGEPAVEFAMNAPCVGLRSVLGQIQVFS